MRDLRLKTTKPAGRNRLKKQRKPINYRGFFKKTIRLVGGVLVVVLIGVPGTRLTHSWRGPPFSGWSGLRLMN